MIEPDGGPFLFDTSAESWFARVKEPAVSEWWKRYLQQHLVHVSAVTVFERVRGYALLWRQADQARRPSIESIRIDYIEAARKVLPVDTTIAATSGEIAALIPSAPTLPKKSHRDSESRAERAARWRFDLIIAATALVTDMTLIHNNSADFEAIRSGIENNPDRFPKGRSLKLVRCGIIGARESWEHNGSGKSRLN